MHTVYFVVILLFSLCQLGTTETDYYWRDYNGIIPKDAVEGGTDLRGKPTYIGQAFVLHHGVLIGQIYPGEKTITTSKQGIHKTTLANKILCSQHKENLVWTSGNAETLHLTTINKHLVPGGTEWGNIISIGRIRYRGEIIVGKVCSGTIGNAKMYFPYKGEEISESSYEILTYEEKPHQSKET